MNKQIGRGFRQAMLALGMAFGGLVSAQAGVVVTDIDPIFGPTLPGLSWSASLSFNLPDSCLQGGSVGHYIQSVTGCGIGPATGSLTLTDMNLGYSETHTFSSNGISSVEVLNGFVVGWNGLMTIWQPSSALLAADGNFFAFRFASRFEATPFIPQLVCLSLSCLPDLVSSYEGFHQLVFNQFDDGSNKLGLDGNGLPIGYEVGLKTNPDGSLERVFSLAVNSVPEPASLALVLGALLTGAWVRQRKQR